MTLETTTITDRPNATLPLTGNERIVMDEVGEGARTVDAPASAIAALATKQTVGLGNVDNTSDANKPVSTAQAAAIASAVSAHAAAADPHPGYLTPAEGNAAYEPVGAAASAVAAHVAAADPHPGYLTPAEGNAAYEPAGAVASHVAAADPHTQYAQTADDLGLGTDDSPTFAGLTITGAGPVVIPHIHGDLAGSLYIHVKNTSGGELAKGTPVRVTGAVGDTTTLEVAAAQSSSAGTMPAIGILGETLAQNASGHAVVAGELTGLSTTGYSVGQALFVAAAGGLTATEPTSGIIQQIAIVGRVHGSTGSVTVTVGTARGQAVGTNLSYDASTRLLGSSTGDDVTLPLVTSSNPGLVPEFGTPTGKVLTDAGWAAPAASGGAFQGYAVGNWIQPVEGPLSAGSSNPSNVINLLPFVVSRSVRIDELGARVTSALSGTTFQLAIYGSTNGLPSGAPLATTGDLSGATATVLSAAVTPFNLTAGLVYFMAANGSGSPNTVVFQAPTPSNNGYATSVLGAESLAIASSSAAVVGWNRSISETYGTWPDLTGQTTTEIAFSRCPAIFLKVGAFI